MQQSTTTKRIEWIDAMRGFTMILVVFSHVQLFGIELPSSHNGINNLFIMFRMPLFFFVSGFIAYRVGEVWEWGHYRDSMLKKMRVQLIPMLFFGLLYAVTVFAHKSGQTAGEALATFFNNKNKIGYWFTEVLLEMFVIYYTVSFLLRRRSLATRQWVLAVVAVGLFALSLADSSTYNGHRVCRWLCLYKLLLYFQFFVMGNLLSCYRERVFRAMEGKFFMATTILLFGVLYVTYRHLHGIEGGTLLMKGQKLVAEGTRIAGVLIMVATFRHYERFFSKATRVGRCLQYIGQRTLDVYLLHFYLLPTLPALGLMLSRAGGVVVETTVVGVLSLLVIGFCLVISNIIRVSPILAYWLLGVKRK